MTDKFQLLKNILTKMESALLAYSGGVDSTFLLKVVRDVLGDNVMAVTAKSIIYPSFEIEEAANIANDLGVNYLTINNDALSNPNFTSNPPDRCYWCKKDLFSQLVTLAKEHNLKYIIDGSNFDDINDFRPGSKAASELGVRSPLKEAKLNKAEIRDLSKSLNLPTWNKPSLACLASRFPYGMTITDNELSIVNNAEEFLRAQGIGNVRVRHHGRIARIEVPEEEIAKLAEKKLRNNIVSKFKEIGYSYVTIDMEGYRTGSMNEVL